MRAEKKRKSELEYNIPIVKNRFFNFIDKIFNIMETKLIKNIKLATAFLITGLIGIFAFLSAANVSAAASVEIVSECNFTYTTSGYDSLRNYYGDELAQFANSKYTGINQGFPTQYYYDSSGTGNWGDNQICDDDQYAYDLNFICYDHTASLFEISFDVTSNSKLLIYTPTSTEDFKIYVNNSLIYTLSKTQHRDKIMLMYLNVGNSYSTIKLTGGFQFGGAIPDDPIKGEIGKPGTLQHDNLKPVVSGNTYSVISNVENPFTWNEIISGIRAIDNTDGDITNNIVYTTNYPKTTAELANLALGNYSVNASVSDAAGNVATFSFNIYVIDINAPTWSGTTSYPSQPNNQKLTLDTIKSNLRCNDSFEGTIPSSNWVLVKDNYSLNYTKPGYYEVEFKACDSSENYNNVIVGITVKDVVKPIITGATTITKQQSVTLTISDIISNYTATDDVDGDISTKIVVDTDGYTGHGATAGTYKITLKVTDKGGNVGTFTVSIIVVDNIPPVYYLDTNTIIVSSASVLTKDQMISVLRQMNKLDVQAVNYVTIESAYFDTPAVVNTYAMRVSIKSSSGIESEDMMTIRVTSADGGTKVTPAQKKWYQKGIFGIFYKIFYAIFHPIKTIKRFLRWIHIIK